MNALDRAACEAVRIEALKAGVVGHVWAQVIFKNPSAVALDVHTVRIQASVGKKWRAMFHYAVDKDFSLQRTFEQFARDFVAFYTDAMLAA